MFIVISAQQEDFLFFILFRIFQLVYNELALLHNQKREASIWLSVQ